MRASEQKEFINFINAKNEILKALGININVPSGGSLEQRFEMIEAQIEELSDEHK